MSQSLSAMYVHLTFHVRNDSVAVPEGCLEKLFAYMAGVIKGCGGNPVQIGGMSDHIHVLSTLPKTMALSDFVRTIKTQSNGWLKSEESQKMKSFAWQNGYGAFSVSASNIDKVKQYIVNQKEHHKKHSFREEYLRFLQAAGIEYDEHYVLSD